MIAGATTAANLLSFMPINNNRKFMGKSTNSWFSNIAGWLITGVSAAAALGLILVR